MIMKVFDASTRHITKECSDKLGMLARGEGIPECELNLCVTERETGFIITYFDSETIAALRSINAEWSNSLLNLLTLAKNSFLCEWISLDRDGSEYYNLKHIIKTYNW